MAFHDKIYSVENKFIFSEIMAFVAGVAEGAEDIAGDVAGGIAGGAMGSVGDIIGAIVKLIARFGSAVIGAFKSILDKVMGVGVRVARIIEKYFKIAIHYVVLFLRLAYRYMYRFYTQFQQNPWKTLQFIGTIAILFTNGLFP
jgi:hypothetical protein